jgi:CheY-like chemotaxis protein
MPFPTPLDRAPSPSEAGADPTHDLKNLLGVLMGVCESLAEGRDSRAEQVELARVGLLAAEKAAGLVTRMQLDNRPRPAAPAEPAGPCDSQGRTVLVVDDDPDLLKLITTAFARAGFKAYSARNGRLAVQLVRALKPDLMVTDIVMPEKEGIATIIEVKAASPDTSVIAISGGGAYGRSGNFLQWAEELGADEVMAKPFPMSQLLTAARVVLDRKGAPNAARAAAG